MKNLVEIESLYQSFYENIVRHMQLTKDALSKLMASPMYEVFKEKDKSKLKIIKYNLEHIDSIPLEKSSIVRFLSEFLDIELSNRSLVDINLQADNSEGNFSIRGRPKVMGSSKKQMRHVTPFSFFKELLKQKIAEADGDIVPLFDSLKEIVKTLDKTGLCFRKEYFEKITENDASASNYITKTLHTDKDVYYFVKEQDIDISELSLDNDDIKEAVILYNDKIGKYIDFVFDVLKKNLIEDKNTFYITNEALIRYILQEFNSHQYAAFPEEGNTLNYQIRLYENEEDIKKGNKKFKVITSDYLASEKESKGNLTDYSGKIRIVKNEGSNVATVLVALKLINELLIMLDDQTQKLNDNDEGINDKIKLYNKKYSLECIGNRGKIELGELDRTQESFYKHIAKNLYIPFDFLELESKVFAAQETGIDIYPSAKGKKRTAKYDIIDGGLYRQNKMEEATGYNDEVTFRTQLSPEQELEILTSLIERHITLSLYIYDKFKISYFLMGGLESGILNPIVVNFLDYITQGNINKKKQLEDRIKDNAMLQVPLLEQNDIMDEDTISLTSNTEFVSSGEVGLTAELTQFYDSLEQ
jgi:hypothetical protein